MTDPAPSLEQRLLTLYPVLADLPESLRGDTLRLGAQAVTVPAGQRLFDEGTPCQGFPMLLSGEVRVARGNANGRSIELYRLGPGELCVVSMSCLFGQALLTAHGSAMQATELVVLSPTAFERWTATPSFRNFVFGIFADRLADLMALTEAVAFQRLDQRLAGCLLGHGAVLQGTHQSLADELGTVREIVSRLLRRFEQAGWIAIGRERLTVLDAAALRALATGATSA